jgi:cytochrome c-type biogenesis protein CcmH
LRRLLLALALLMSPAAYAQQEWTQQPAAALTPEVEQTAREVGKSLRCVVCQNQSIEESNAPLAEDMRRLVRERLAAGDTRDEVMTFMTDRYGNFVRLQPPFQIDTLFLWLGPALFLAVAIWAWLAYLRPQAKRSHAPAPLTEAEAAALNQRISEGGQS